jgi:hypothetical protein
MSKPPAELERLADCLRGLVQEHRLLLDLVNKHQAAMKKVDASAIDLLNQQQEQARTRIIQWEARRRLTVTALAKVIKMTGEPTLTRIASVFPAQRNMLLKLRDELRILATEIKDRTSIGARVAQAMLGHLNTAVRLLASAVERGGTYTKQGAPKLTRRIGTIEAVG